MYDIIIVGLGPAGIQAAIYLKRFNYNVLLIGDTKSNLKFAHKIENYYGVGVISGSDLFEAGLKQARDLNIEIKNEVVLGIENLGTFNVKTKDNNYEAKKIFLATGAAKAKLPGLNVDKYESNGLSYCAICDAFFYKNKKIAIIGTTDYMKSELEVLEKVTSNITVFTNSKDLEVEVKYPLVKEKIVSFYGDDFLEGIETTTNKYEFDAVFVAVGSAGSFDFAKHLGLILDENKKLVVDKDNMTNIDGVYAGGDNTGEPLQIAKAVYEGMKAAFAIDKKLSSK